MPPRQVCKGRTSPVKLIAAWQRLSLQESSNIAAQKERHNVMNDVPLPLETSILWFVGSLYSTSLQ